MPTITVDGQSREVLGYSEDREFKNRINIASTLTVDGQSRSTLGTQVTLDSVTQFKVKNQKDVEISKGSGSPTFTRASKAYVMDFEKLVQVQDNSPSFPGLRAASNLCLQSQAINVSPWSLVGATTPDATTLTFDASGSSRILQNFATATAGVYRITATLSGTVGKKVNFTLGNGGVTIGGGMQITLSTTPTVYSALVNMTGVTTGDVYASINNSAWFSLSAGSASHTMTVTNIQLENLTGATNQNPSEYIPTTSAPLTKWFDYANPYTVDGNGVVTDSGVRTQAYTSQGLLSEPAGTNQLLQSQAMTTTPWSTFNANTTVTPGILAPDGTLTAFQIDMSTTLTGIKNDVAGSGAQVAWCGSVWIKGDTAGTIRFFDANGGNWDATVNVTTSWTRVQATAVKSSLVGVMNQFAVYRNSAGQLSRVYVWGAQLETGSVATSYMPTTTGTATRAATVDSYPVSGNVSDTAGSLYIEFKPISDGGAVGGQLVTGSGAGSVSGNTLLFQNSTPGTIYTYDGTTLLASSAATVNAVNKCIVTWSGSTKKICLNGGAVQSNTYDGAFGLGTNLNIGTTGNGTTNTFLGYIKNVTIYNTALSDAECIRMTT